MWIATFADMMSLLMCFFVLLLSYSDMDVEKYKQISGSMKEAFGAQKKVKQEEDPSGKSAVRGELAPGGKSNTQSSLAHAARQKEKSEGVDEEKIQKKLEEDLKRIKEALDREVKEGKIDVQGGDGQITLRIQEKSAFSSGKSDVVEGFAPILEKIGKVLRDTQGRIAVAGHTDDRPINTKRYRSNWELSASRAVTVVHHLLDATDIPHFRVEVRGYGDSVPLVPNDSPENRAINRRVEIVVSTTVKPEGDGLAEGGLTDKDKADAATAAKAVESPEDVKQTDGDETKQD